MAANYRSPCSCGAFTETNGHDWQRGRLRPKCSKCGSTLESRGRTFKRSKEANAARKADQQQQLMTGTMPLRPYVKNELDKLAHLTGKASLAGLTTAVTYCGGKRFKTAHVMFNTDGQRILDYWPSTGTVKIGGTSFGRKGKAESIENAFAMAIDAKAKLTGKIFPESEKA